MLAQLLQRLHVEMVVGKGPRLEELPERDEVRSLEFAQLLAGPPPVSSPLFGQYPFYNEIAVFS